MSNFEHPKAGGPGVVSIGSSDNTALTVHAQYNPKELQIDKSVPWQKNPQSNKAPDKGIQLEFTGAEGRSMSLELLFDGYEQKASVSGQVDMLNAMASPIKAGSSDENERRPHLCLVKWGDTVPSFKCVIESLSTKYTMFSDNGVPLRATCTVKLKEADTVSMAKADGAAGGSTAPAAGGGTGGTGGTGGQ
jgi:phage protein U